jgi:putative transcriptional regulator
MSKSVMAGEGRAIHDLTSSANKSWMRGPSPRMTNWGGQRDMSKTGTMRVIRKPGDPLPQGKTDWAHLLAMTDEEAEANARSDPDAQPIPQARLAAMRRVSRVKVLRQRLGMTQAEFAQAFHLPISTLRDWEQRRSMPDAPARALLLAIERDPDAMRRLLAAA